MDDVKKSKLTGGTLFIIAILILIFGNARTIEVIDKLNSIQNTLDKVQEQTYKLQAEIEELRKENEKLRENKSE
ncbi:hypothetical protein [Aliikangiella sp. G2MR2-5]|uniref:hypothetical protein n=1 Tax=Aliikangiella sp. G2MR2-5 TaxID=2788943 RepID=UPI0018AB1F6C|nr:hypothetical protein [Aliikangiella sp. G2MR2-5]